MWKTSLTILGLYLAVIVAVVWGYILNLLAVIHLVQAGGEIGGEMVLRGLGLFLPPAGAIIGWVL